MPDKEKESVQVGKWQDRLSVSKRWQRQVAEQNSWERYNEELKGLYDVVLGNNYVPPINEVFAYKDSLISNLYFRDPYLAVNPRKNATIQSSYILESAVNYYWNELEVKDEVEMVLTDTILIGHGWSKVGTNVRTSGSGDSLQLEKDALYVNRVSWRDMFMNVGCKKPTKDNLWIAQRIYRPTNDLKKEYPRLASRIQGSPYPTVDREYMKRVMFKDDFLYTAIYEIWDAHDRMIYMTADAINDRYLGEPRPWPDYLKNFPFQFMSFHDLPDDPYPQSDIAPWEPQLREKIKLFTQMLNHIKRWNRQMLLKKGTMSVADMDKFEKGFDGAILTATTSGDIQAAVKMLDFGTLPPDIYMALDRIDAVIRTTRGLAEFMQGGVTKTTTRTEGELQMIKTGADARSDRKQARIERHCENIARAMIAEMKNQFDLPVITKITGKEPPEIIAAFQEQGMFNPVSQTITFAADDIRGEYDVKVKSGSTLPLDKMTRDKILDQVLQIGAQMAAAPSIPPFVAEIIKERLRDYDLPQLNVAFDEQQKQQEAQRQESAANEDVNTEKTRAEAAKRQAQTNEIQIDTMIKGIQAAGKATGELSPEESLT